MNNNDLLQLAFSVYNSPGVYALLLGSGISSSAGILTGWDIVKDLIRQIAAVRREELTTEAPEVWYERNFGKPPRYDDLLNELGRTPAARNALIRHYFEPTDEEREQGIKLPTKAHKAIASLIKDGYIRVVLTTNFDTLLEIALEEIGVRPDVISSVDMLKGARPLQHSPITIMKLHGDYRDERIRNTDEELRGYSEEFTKLLDRIFDEYGLIICGWSAIWDTALRDSIYRMTNHRYARYWSFYGLLSEEATRLAQLRDFQLVGPSDAETFFKELKESVLALGSANRKEHPLIIPVAIERVKKLVAQPNGQIELDELILSFAKSTYKSLTGNDFLLKEMNFLRPNAAIDDVWKLNFDVSLPIVRIMATLARYSNPTQTYYVTDAITRWASLYEVALTKSADGIIWRLLPVTFLTYASGIAALLSRNWGCLTSILVRPTIKLSQFEGNRQVLSVLDEHFFLQYRRSVQSPNYVAVNLRIKELLQPVFEDLTYTSNQYADNFDLWEMLIALVILLADSQGKNAPKDKLFVHAALADPRSWDYLIHFWSSELPSELLNAGFFGNSPELLENCLRHYQEISPLYRQATHAPSPDFATAFKRSLEG